MLLIILEDPKKLEILKMEQDKKFSKEKKINRYTKKYKEFLENLFIMNNWSINTDIINDVIEKAFQLKKHPYKDEFTERLKMLFEIYGTIDNVIEYLKNENISIAYNTIKKHIKKLLNKKEYTIFFKKSIKNPLEIDGISFFDKWNKNNSGIIIDEKTGYIANKSNLKNRVRKVLENPLKFKNACIEIAGEYSWDVIGGRIIKEIL